MINIPVYDAIQKKTDFIREQPTHQPKVSQKPNFMVILQGLGY